MTDSQRRTGPGSLIRRIVQRLRIRPDSEHEMRFNGVALSTATLIYLLATNDLGFDEFVVYTTYIGFCVLIFAHILYRPGVCHTRRIIAMIGDLGVLFSEMYIRGETAAFLFPCSSGSFSGTASDSGSASWSWRRQGGWRRSAP